MRTVIELVSAAALLAIMGLAALVLLARTPVARWRIGLPVMLVACLGASRAAGWAFHDLDSTGELFLPLVLVLAVPLVLARSMRWPSRFFFSSTVLMTVVFASALLMVTYAAHASLMGLGLSVLLLAMEFAALALSLVFAFEIADVLGRDAVDPAPPPGSDYAPRVCIQVPAYNEPPELLRQTLEALANLDYPNFIVQVIVNNTTDPALWMPVEADCRRLGSRFRFIHLPSWPGFKSGALNEGTRRLDADVEIVGIVDADYVVRPDFLHRCVPHLADPTVAFVQTPQHYREWEDSPYLRGLFYAYRYFFDVTMVARARVNAIIFGGTMGLIRVAALKQIGGWAEWCITEDAEASLRLLARGWKARYVNQVFGEGLMPLDFDGLRRQRFRWAFGGVQILRRHFWMLTGRARSRLTLAQRYHYLAGALGWFADPVGVGLAIFLLLTSPFLAFGQPLLLRQLVGVLLVMPVLLLVAGLVRLGWTIHAACRAPWRDVPAAAMVMLALSFTVARACTAALVTNRGVFLRTPKVRGPSGLGRAVLATVPESAMAVAFAAMAVPVALFGPTGIGPICAALLAWQALAWGSAPAASLLAQGIVVTPARIAFRRSPQTTGARPWVIPDHPRRLLIAAVVVVVVLLLTPALVSSPESDSGLRNALAAVPPPFPRQPTPRPSPSRSVAPSPTGVTSAAASPSFAASPRAAPTAPPTGQPTPSPPASAAPPLPSAVPSPSHPAPSPSPRPTISSTPR